MTIEQVTLFRYAVPLRAPLVLKSTTLHRREGMLVRLASASGAEGWGEAAPLPGFSPETLDEAGAALAAVRQDLLGQAVADNPLDPAGRLAGWLDARPLPPSARFALDTALGDLFAAASGTTRLALLSDAWRPVVMLNGLLLGSDADLRAGARRLRAEGYPAVKLKVGRRPVDEDAARVRAVADELGPGLGLRLDANRAWTMAEAVAFAEAVAGIAIEYLEEPLAEAAGLPAFVARTGVPVALDESVVGMAPAAVAAHGYAHALLLKPTLVGGLVAARRLAAEAVKHGIVPVVSAAFEAGIGMRALVALAAAVSEVPAGLDPYRRLAADVLAPPLPWTGGAVNVAACLAPRRVLTDQLVPFDAG